MFSLILVYTGKTDRKNLEKKYVLFIHKGSVPLQLSIGLVLVNLLQEKKKHTFFFDRIELWVFKIIFPLFWDS
jgi:hypothetical protein